MRPSSLLILLAAVSSCLLWRCSAAGDQPLSARTACLHSCHTCQRMYGDHFAGHLCAHTCLRLKGLVVPDCADLASIAPYLDVDDNALRRRR